LWTKCAIYFETLVRFTEAGVTFKSQDLSIVAVR